MERNSFFEDATYHMVENEELDAKAICPSLSAVSAEQSSASVDNDTDRDIPRISNNGQPGNAAILSKGLFLFVLGEDTDMNTFELGILNETPDALDKITSNPALSTSAFLRPALNATLSELRPLLTAQVAARLTAVSLRLAVEIFTTLHVLRCTFDSREQQQLANIVCHQLNVALPYYKWQGDTNWYAKIHYLIVLLEEAVRTIAVPFESLVDALRLDAVAVDRIRCLTALIKEFKLSHSSVLGPWASTLLTTAWLELFTGNSSRTSGDLRTTRNSLGTGSSEAGHPTTPSETAANAPSFSEPIPDNCRPKSCTDTRGDDASNPVELSETEGEYDLSLWVRKQTPPRRSHRAKALKAVNYDTKRHPQDEALSPVRKRGRTNR